MSVRPLTDQSVLPMAGLTHGRRSPVTCHLRCGDACSSAAPNSTETSYFRDVATRALSRRGVLGAGAAGAGVLALTGGGLVSPAAARPTAKPGRPGGLPFEPIGPVATTVDDVTVPAGYGWDPIIRWGDPILPGAPAFDATKQTPEKQAGQFGYNNDYLDILETDRSGTRALLVCNHEYTNEGIMFPPGTDPDTVIRTAWAAHGMSVVELRRARRGKTWTYIPGARLNRRITLDTPFAVDGPAAGSELLKTAADPTGRRVLGTMNNCAGGTTPWGTVLSGEENFNQYFRAAGTTPRESRYGLSPNQDSRNWRSVDPRWDATNPAYANEPNRFGWIVELDPHDRTSTPVKHTAMGRFKHEGANVIVNNDGHVVAYMGDDERFDYLYRFVSRNKIKTGGRSGHRKHNLRLLSEGDLSVARFTGDGLGDGVSDGTGEWIPSDPRRTVHGPGLHPRGGAGLHATGCGRRAADEDGPARGRRTEPGERLRVCRVHQQHRPRQGRQGGPDRAQPPRRQQGRSRRRDHPHRR